MTQIPDGPMDTGPADRDERREDKLRCRSPDGHCKAAAVGSLCTDETGCRFVASWDRSLTASPNCKGSWILGSACGRCSRCMSSYAEAIGHLRAALAEAHAAKVPAVAFPWNRGRLRGWAIVGMNHYHVSGERHLFVAMTREGRCIHAEGPNEPNVWDALERLAGN